MDTRFNGQDPMSVNTRLEGRDAPPKRDNDIGLDIAELREKMTLMLEINKRIAAKAPQVGRTIRDQINMLERFTARFK